MPNGEVYLMYKSSSVDTRPPLLLGAAYAKKGYGGPYERLSDEPVFSFHSQDRMDNDVEDPFVWWTGKQYELILKDRLGHICGEEGGGLHATSKKEVNWKISQPVKAYSRHITRAAGSKTVQASFARPFFFLTKENLPTYLQPPAHGPDPICCPNLGRE
jgi:hypothetical protein